VRNFPKKFKLASSGVKRKTRKLLPKNPLKVCVAEKVDIHVFPAAGEMG
jgi:hypothetical protein